MNAATGSTEAPPQSSLPPSYLPNAMFRDGLTWNEVHVVKRLVKNY